MLVTQASRSRNGILCVDFDDTGHSVIDGLIFAKMFNRARVTLF